MAGPRGPIGEQESTVRRPGREPVVAVGADDGRAPVSRSVVALAVVLSMVVAAGAVVVAARQLSARGHDDNAISLDATAISLPGEADSAIGAAAGSAAPTAVPGSTRLALLGPLTLVDSRTAGKVAPGASTTLPLPSLPAGTTAVLVEVSVVDATGPGAVTVTSEVGDVTALRVPRAGAQLSATIVAMIGGDGGLRVRSEGGGHVVVTLMGAFEPAEKATAGRIVPIPPAEVVRLVPQSDGKDTDIDVAAVPALADAGTVSAVLLSVSADVGTNGGTVAVGPAADQLTQTAFWSATAGADRTRYAFLFVPVVRGRIHLHYEAGTELRASIAGYVTAANAPQATTGLLVPRPPQPIGPVAVAAGQSSEVSVVGAPGAGGVPAERVEAAVVGVSATGEALGAVNVLTPGSPAPATPTFVAPQGQPRAVVSVVSTTDGKVQVASEAGASATVTPQALILRG